MKPMKPMPVWPRDERHQIERYLLRGDRKKYANAKTPTLAKSVVRGIAASMVLALVCVIIAAILAALVAWVVAPLIGWGLSYIPAACCGAAVIYSGFKTAASL